MAYVALLVRGGTAPEHDHIREALISRFADDWGELAVELTLDGPLWHIHKATLKSPGEAARNCRELVQRTLNLVDPDRDVYIW
jgi:hypothetical protein